MKRIRKKGATTISKAPTSNPLSEKQRSYIIDHYYYIMNFDKINANSELTGTEKLILSMVLTFQLHGQQFYQGVRTLARELTVNKYTIVKSIHDLMNKEYITCKNLKGKHTNNIIRRYIYVNLRKTLGKPDRTPTKFTNHLTSPKTKRLQHKMPSNPLKLTNKQSQLINRITKDISKNSTHSNPISIRRAFISEYENHKLNINNLTNALVAYKYDKNIKKKSIKSTIGYICSLSNDIFHKGNIHKMKFAIKKQKNPSYDGFDYQDEF